MFGLWYTKQSKTLGFQRKEMIAEALTFMCILASKDRSKIIRNIIESGSRRIQLGWRFNSFWIFRCSKKPGLNLTTNKQGFNQTNKVEVSQPCPTLCDPMNYTVHEFSRPDPGVGSLSLIQGIFPTQGSNPGLLYCRQILYQLIHKGSPRILEWVAYPFSSGSSWPKNRTRVAWVQTHCLSSHVVARWPQASYLTSLCPISSSEEWAPNIFTFPELL